MIIIIVIFITGLHKKPHGCGASVASAAGPSSSEIWTSKFGLHPEDGGTKILRNVGNYTLNDTTSGPGRTES
jgi:hypothetical protein